MQTTYTIQQLADLAGVSVRTLHHYDAIGLLSPTRAKRNGYRTYEEKDLFALQQILFFRELDFPLNDIKKIMSSPGFDMAEALRDQRKLIELKRERLGRLIKTIDKTIKTIHNETTMDNKELYDNFGTEEMEALAQEAKERWGHTDAYKESEQKLRTMDKAGWDKIKQEGHDILSKGAALIERGISPDSPEAEALIAEHYRHLHNFYTPSYEMYKGLADMYVTDPRFRAHFEQYHKDLPQFMHDAMIHYIELHK